MSFLWLPALCGVIYPVAFLMLHRLIASGAVGMWRSAFVVNLTSAALAAPLWWWGGEIGEGARWWQPVLTAVAFLAGQTFTFLAFERGAASVVTPLLGSKVVLVTVLMLFVGDEPISWGLWVAAGLTCLALYLLNRDVDAARSRQQERKGKGTIFFALASALFFACNDVACVVWGRHWGPTGFAAAFYAAAAVGSFYMVARFRAPLWKVPRLVWPRLLLGASLVGTQGVILAVTFARFGEPTAINVVYNLRGIVSVLLVWWAGHWFDNKESQAGRGVMISRLIGAGLILLAIVLVTF